MKPKSVRLPSQQMARSLGELSSVDRENRTIEVVWTTGSRGLRRGWDGPYYEELSLDPSHLNLSRLKGGASVLDAHDQYSGLRGIIGVVEDAWIVSPTEARAKLKFSSDEAKQGAVNDIMDGIIRNLSVGYSIRKLVQVGTENDIPVLRAEDWEPFELSFVPVPFDAGAQSRSNDENTTDCTVITTQGNEKMLTEAEKEAKRLAAKTKQDDAVRAAEEATAVRVRAEEGERLRAITEITSKHGLDASIAQRCFTEGKDINQTREFVLDHLAEVGARTAPKSTITAGAMDEKTTLVRAAEEAILVRAAPQHNKPTELSNRFRSSSLLDIVRDILHMDGVRTQGMSKNEIAARGFHTTSDFPGILGNSVKKILADSYRTAPSDYQFLTRPIGLSDYKSMARYGLSTGPALLEVKEHGEYKRGSVAESSEFMQLKKYGRVLGITREAIINDDLNAFSDIPRMWAFACANLQANLVWQQLNSNPTMGDGNALFSVAHKNLAATPSVLDLANLELAVTTIEQQQGFSAPGEDIQYLGQKAKYLIVGPSLKYAAIKLTTSVDPIINAAVNPFTDLIVKSDPRITDNRWYVAGDLTYADGIGLLHLIGEEGPQLDQRQGFDVDGVEYKVRMDTGAKILDWRPFFMNAGI